MSDILCVTNRLLCREDFVARIEKIASARPAGIILREKDLSETEYKELAKAAMNICRRYGTLCILHSFSSVAAELNSTSLHLPLHLLRGLSAEEKRRFSVLGASCHSAREAIEAEKLGCTYITAGHVFDTDCKKGLPGRGLDFLEGVCESVSIPVYAIGGISAENIGEVRKSGAAGACVMSGTMISDDVQRYLSAFEGVGK